MKPAKCAIGTSGWSYPHWAKGRFYPKGLPPGQWLRYFSKHFNTVEINSSFYRLPRPEFMDRWRGETGQRFRFAVKLWRRITHDKRLRDCGPELADFFTIAKRLGPKRGPLLVQLPPSMPKDLGLLEAFIDDLHRAQGRSRWRVSIEFRASDWLCDAVYELLDAHDLAVCLADLERCPITKPNQASFVYLRRHGPGGAYRGCYGAKHIAADATRIRAWLASGRDVYAYFNNDAEGYAIDNARQLREAVGTETCASA